MHIGYECSFECGRLGLLGCAFCPRLCMATICAKKALVILLARLTGCPQISILSRVVPDHERHDDANQHRHRNSFFFGGGGGGGGGELKVILFIEFHPTWYHLSPGPAPR